MNESMLDIHIGPTYVSFKVNERGCVVVEGRSVHLGEFIKDNLQETEFNPRFRRFMITNRYSIYDSETGTVRIPRHALAKLLHYINNRIPINIIEDEPVKPRSIKASMKKGFSFRTGQEEMVEFIMSPGSFKPINAQVGQGKTSVAIYSIVALGKVTLIQLPMLISQWHREIRKFSNISKDDIYIVQGFNRLADLWKMHEGGFRPKIIIFSTRTLHMYAIHPEAPYSELPSYYEFQKQFGIGVKILDETHLNFCTNTCIDLYSCIEKNIYLSATYMRSDPQGARIFNLVFPADMRFGAQFKSKHCNVYILQYHLGLLSDIQGKFICEKGYNHAKYENFIRKQKVYGEYFVYSVLLPVMQQYYFGLRKPGQKLLVIGATHDFICYVYDKIKSRCADYGYTCTPYFSGDPKYGKDELLTKNDIILSTPKSCGTGRDIANLKTCINTMSFRSPVLTNQMMGRLRKLPDDEVIFVDLWNGDLNVHGYHVNTRRRVYQQIAKATYDETFN